MTPPQKKTSRAPSAAKRGEAKPAAPKKRRTRKKKSGGLSTALIAAFVVGIILTLSAVWLVSRLDTLNSRGSVAASGSGQKQGSPAKSPGPSGKNAAQSSPSASNPSQRAASDGSSGGSSAGSSGSPSMGSSTGSSPGPSGGASAGSFAGQAAQPSSAQSQGKGSSGSTPASPKADAQPKGDSPARADAAPNVPPTVQPRTEGAVTSALIDLKALPYEESLNASLDERIRQVDYALMQTAWLKKIPASHLRLVSVEDRLEGTEPYQYQIIDILPGKTAKEYTDTLKSSLSAWAEGAVLKEQGDNRWSILINGVETHHVRLFPGRGEFPPLPTVDEGGPSSDTQVQPGPGLSGGGPGVPSVPPRPGIGRHKLRAPGEAAKLVIVIDDLGASPTAVQQLLALDYPVTFAFWPHGGHTRQGAEAAHQAGREILIHQPMEPLGYPRVRPGPNVLLVGMPPDQIRAILTASFAAVPHAVGLNNHMGSRFTQNAAGVDTVIASLKQQGLFMLDSVTHNNSIFADEGRRLGMETYQRSVFLDVTAARSKIMSELKRAEHIALLTGECVAIGHPLPETLAALKEWQRTRNREVILVTLRDLGSR